MKRARISVDRINTFREGWQLPVTGADASIEPNNKSVREGDYELRVMSGEKHPHDHDSFCTVHGVEPLTVVDGEIKWPPHGRDKTPESEWAPGVDIGLYDVVVIKGHRYGEHPYSAFGAFVQNGEVITEESLDDRLKSEEITHVDVDGWAGDFCSGDTALDSAKLGYKTRFLAAFSPCIAEESWLEMKAKLEAAGVEIVEEAI